MDGIQLFDTHCHIQSSSLTDDYHDTTQKLWARAGHPVSADIIADSKEQGVSRLMVVGCAFEDSTHAIALAQKHDNVWASIGIHPHEAQNHLEKGLLDDFAELAAQPKVKAIGECGLDYFYNHSPKAAQEEVLRFQLALAQENNLPVIFHVREAFADFWPIFDTFPGITGIIHSFTGTQDELEQILSRGLSVGVNGIMTFTKSAEQLAVAKAIPLNRLVLETDAPFLTPAPYRGTICLPKHVRVTAEFLANLRHESLQDLAEATTANAQKIFDV